MNLYMNKVKATQRCSPVHVQNANQLRINFFFLEKLSCILQKVKGDFVPHGVRRKSIGVWDGTYLQKIIFLSYGQKCSHHVLSSPLVRSISGSVSLRLLFRPFVASPRCLRRVQYYCLTAVQVQLFFFYIYLQPAPMGNAAVPDAAAHLGRRLASRYMADVACFAQVKRVPPLHV